MSTNDQPDFEDRIVADFGAGHSIDDIAQRYGISPAEINAIIHRNVGPMPGTDSPGSAPFPPPQAQSAPPPHAQSTPPPGWAPPGAEPPQVVIVQSPPSSVYAIASLILGIISLMGGFCVCGLPCIAAVVCGHLGLRETKDGSKSGYGMAVAGLIMGYLLIIPTVFLFITGGITNVLTQFTG
ncbi:DUF4190 domain-containing protein [Actinoplanes sp. NPDC051851]|uniref:DUF4190 domain-containing protein n=1 Tax=Actinoplanes sp. NPDC051851 TaxID=3154753 RepID=UPI00344AA124